MTQTFIVGNGTLVTLSEETPVIPNGAVLIENNTITAVGTTQALQKPGVEFIDAQGRLIMPGLICAHHHLYSTFACGLGFQPAHNFVEVLENLWWKLDRALDLDDVYYSAMIPLARCIQSGTTTLIDHHASPTAIPGSLNKISTAVKQAGLRASLCYEITDRNGLEGTQAGLAENEAWLQFCRTDENLHGLVGVHASMTVGEETLGACVQLAEKYQSGLHIHVAESAADQEYSLKHYNKRVVERLQAANALGPNTILVHCVHINEAEMDLISKSNTIVVHNPQSNMNNAVGCADVPKLLAKNIRVGLGTDGMTSNMLEEARTSLFIRHHMAEDPSVGFMDTVNMLFQNNAQIASQFFGKKIGVLEPGAAADLIIVNHRPFTPLTSDTTYGHLLFGAAAESVDTTICNGKVLMRNGKLQSLNMEEIAQDTAKRTESTWQRFTQF